MRAMRKTIGYEIEKVKLRKIITVPHVIVSDYKGHDSVFVKCYFDELLLGTQKIFYYEAMHRGGLGFQLSACWCPACIRGKRSGAFKTIEGCFSREPMEYKIIKCTDAAWVIMSKARVRSSACYLFNTLTVGDVTAFDPILPSGSRMQRRLNIGQVVRTSYPYDIEVSIWKSVTSKEYIKKPSVQNIHRDAVRFTFVNSPIIQNKIVLTEEIFSTTTKKFYNGI
jgi:hypothetical protein